MPKTLDLFARALGTERAASGLARAKSTTEYLLKAWRRIARNVFLVLDAAFCSQLSSALLALAGHRAQRASDLEVSPSRKPKPDSRSPKSVTTDVDYAVWTWGRRLPMMTGSSTDAEPHIVRPLPEECAHPPSCRRNGGNRYMLYAACTMCRARWERIPIALNRVVGEASGELVPRHLIYQLDVQYCPNPECKGAQMALRRNNSDHGLFWGCPNYAHPRSQRTGCRETKSLLVNGSRVRLEPQTPATFIRLAKEERREQQPPPGPPPNVARPVTTTEEESEVFDLTMLDDSDLEEIL